MGNKELFVLRHAKSSWDESEKQDFDRALKMKGILDARELAAKLSKRLKNLDLILTSPANRAVHTAVILATAAGVPLDKISLSKKIYEADEAVLGKLVMSIPPEISSAMIVGHNPAFTYFVNTFLPEPIYNLPTCGLAYFRFGCNLWAEIAKGSMVESFTEFPHKEH